MKIENQTASKKTLEEKKSKEKFLKEQITEVDEEHKKTKSEFKLGDDDEAGHEHTHTNSDYSDDDHKDAEKSAEKSSKLPEGAAKNP
jgi:hypothetical protein